MTTVKETLVGALPSSMPWLGQLILDGVATVALWVRICIICRELAVAVGVCNAGSLLRRV